MNKGIKALASCMIALSLGLVAAPKVSASSAPWKDIKTTGDSSKVWTVKFSSAVDTATLSNTNLIYVINEGTNNKVEIQLIPLGGNSVQVKPVAAYADGTYKLVVSDQMKNGSKKAIKQGYEMEFKVTSTSTSSYIKQSDVTANWNDNMGLLAVTVKPSSAEVFSIKVLSNGTQDITMHSSAGNSYEGALKLSSKPSKITVIAYDADDKELQRIDYSNIK